MVKVANGGKDLVIKTLTGAQVHQLEDVVSLMQEAKRRHANAKLFLQLQVRVEGSRAAVRSLKARAGELGGHIVYERVGDGIMTVSFEK
jgi:hypothetical protein